MEYKNESIKVIVHEDENPNNKAIWIENLVTGEKINVYFGENTRSMTSWLRKESPKVETRTLRY